jgi:hypothetical protein
MPRCVLALSVLSVALFLFWFPADVSSIFFTLFYFFFSVFWLRFIYFFAFFFVFFLFFAMAFSVLHMVLFLPNYTRREKFIYFFNNCKKIAKKQFEDSPVVVLLTYFVVALTMVHAFLRKSDFPAVRSLLSSKHLYVLFLI